MAAIYTSGTGSGGYLYITNTGTTTTASTSSYTTINNATGITVYDDDVDWKGASLAIRNNKVDLYAGLKAKLPDGSIIDIDKDGNYTIDDKNAKRVYKAHRILEFNKYLNASDLLESFIEDLGKANVKQGEVLQVPIEMFINWLIHRAAEADNDPMPQDVPRLEDYRQPRHRCKHCGRFLRTDFAQNGLNFCNQLHFQKHMEKLNGRH